MVHIDTFMPIPFLLESLQKKRLGIKSKLNTEQLTIHQRLCLEQDLWKIERQLYQIQKNTLDSADIELRGQNMRN